MTDYFALLDEPRRPWLDAEALKIKFLALSGEQHPDKVVTTTSAEKEAAHQRFTALNSAYQCLREPKDRLLHLLVLELGAEPRAVRQIPPALADLIIPAEGLCREVTAFLAEKARATSPLLQVQFFEHGMTWTDKITEAQQKLGAFLATLENELQQLNATWKTADGADVEKRRATLPLARLEEIYRSYSYANRYRQQLQERIVQLAF